MQRDEALLLYLSPDIQAKRQAILWLFIRAHLHRESVREHLLKPVL
jgi:hypothetical protein